MRDHFSGGTTFFTGAGIAFDINNAGWVVGSAGEVDNETAFVWDGTSLVDLNTFADAALWLSLVSAQAINENGDIVGFGFDINGDLRPFLALNNDFTPVPVPGAVWLLGSGLAAILGLRRNRLV